MNPHDPEAGITKLKDGRTHLAYKAEHAVDLETGAVVAVTVATGDAGDTSTILETLPQAGEHITQRGRRRWHVAGRNKWYAESVSLGLLENTICSCHGPISVPLAQYFASCVRV